MIASIDFSAATSAQIEAALCRRLVRIRLARNTTQVKLAEEAGVSANRIRQIAAAQRTDL